MASLKKAVSSHPQLAGHTLITNEEELDSFLAAQRQDWYGPDTGDLGKIRETFRTWLKAGKRWGSPYHFYAVHDEKDDFARNDDWGNNTLYRCAATSLQGGEVVIMKEIVQKFMH